MSANVSAYSRVEHVCGVKNICTAYRRYTRLIRHEILIQLIFVLDVFVFYHFIKLQPKYEDVQQIDVSVENDVSSVLLKLTSFCLQRI